MQTNQSAKFSLIAIWTLIFCMSISSFVATQYLAVKLGYQEGLGDALVVFKSGKKIYAPFSWWEWNFKWMHEQGRLRDYITQMQYLLIIGALISVVIAIYVAYRRSSKNHLPDDLHGSARFATEEDIEKMKLISYEHKKGLLRKRTIKYRATGIYVGAIQTKSGIKALRYNHPAHVLCFAPSRSGKGVGLVLPTLLSYPHSTAANDVKKENFELSSGFRHRSGSLVICFDPTSVNQKSIDGQSIYNASSGWNVLDEIRLYSEYEVMDAQNIAGAIADPDGEGMSDHWVSTSYELLTGVILHILYYERDKTLSGVATYLADPSFDDPEQMYLRMLNAEHDPRGKMNWKDSSGNKTKTHPNVAICARAMLNKEEKERNSVLSSAKTRLSLYTEPIVARNIARSDFKMRDLMNHDKPVSLYIVVPPSDKERLRPLLRLFFTFLIQRLAADMEFDDGQNAKNYLHRLLLLIDELPSLKKLEILQDGLSYIAGYGITAFLFAQDTIQLKGIYGEKESITSGCQLRVAFAPNTLETAQNLSSMTGITTRKRQNVSYSGNRISAMLGQMSVSEDMVERELLTADEVMRLPRDELLAFNAGHPVIRGKKIYYYNIPAFLKRASISPPSRVAINYEKDGKPAHHWIMLLCERVQGSMDFDVTINSYDIYPSVNVVVKQEDLDQDIVLSFDYELIDMNGKAVDRMITTEDLHFRIRPKNSIDGFDPLEAYEVHFLVSDQKNYPGLTTTGFFRDMSIYERDTRRAVKKHFYELEQKTGKEIDLKFEKTIAGKRYSGTVLMHTEKYVVLQKGEDRISLHRKQKIDQIPAIGSDATIVYHGKCGNII